MDIKRLLEISVKSKASDLHLLPGLTPLLRINGSLAPIKDISAISPDKVADMIYSLMTEEQRAQFESERVFETALVIPKVGNFRMSALHQLQGVAAVFRVISENIPTYEDLLLPSVVKNLLNLSQGLILITGPTGSGKTTTLAAMLDYINT